MPRSVEKSRCSAHAAEYCKAIRQLPHGGVSQRPQMGIWNHKDRLSQAHTIKHCYSVEQHEVKGDTGKGKLAASLLWSHQPVAFVGRDDMNTERGNVWAENDLFPVLLWWEHFASLPLAGSEMCLLTSSVVNKPLWTALDIRLEWEKMALLVVSTEASQIFYAIKGTIYQAA